MTPNPSAAGGHARVWMHALPWPCKRGGPQTKMWPAGPGPRREGAQDPTPPPARPPAPAKAALALVAERMTRASACFTASSRSSLLMLSLVCTSATCFSISTPPAPSFSATSTVGLPLVEMALRTAGRRRFRAASVSGEGWEPGRHEWGHPPQIPCGQGKTRLPPLATRTGNGHLKPSRWVQVALQGHATAPRPPGRQCITPHTNQCALPAHRTGCRGWAA